MRHIGLVLLASGLLFISCGSATSLEGNASFCTVWEDAPVPDPLYLTGTVCTIVADSFICYSLDSAKAKTLYPYWRGSIGKKNGSYAACGFEGKIRCQSGDMGLYGFTMNADYPRYLTYYMFVFDSAGTFYAYWYDANTATRSLLGTADALAFGGVATDSATTYTVRAEQVSKDSLRVFVNGVQVCTVSPLVRTEGVLGVLMTMQDAGSASESHPLACTFRFDKVQYRERP